MHDEHIGRLLLRAHRVYGERALAKLHARGHRDLGMAHVTLLPYIDPDEGTRTSTLGERAGISKQAAGQIVSDLETAGYVRRAGEEGDARASRVLFTKKGRQLFDDALAVKHDIDGELAAVIGAKGLENLRKLLVQFLEAEPPPSPPAPAPARRGRRA